MIVITTANGDKYSCVRHNHVHTEKINKTDTGRVVPCAACKLEEKNPREAS